MAHRPNRSAPAVVLDSLKLATILKLNDEELTIVAAMVQLHGDTTTQLKSLISKFNLEMVALTPEILALLP